LRVLAARKDTHRSERQPSKQLAGFFWASPAGIPSND